MTSTPNRRHLLALAGAASTGPAFAQSQAQSFAAATAAAATAPDEPLQPGPFQPSWESLGSYQTPEWFRDAKFGIWATGARSASPRWATGTPEIILRRPAQVPPPHGHLRPPQPGRLQRRDPALEGRALAARRAAGALQRSGRATSWRWPTTTTTSTSTTAATSPGTLRGSAPARPDRRLGRRRAPRACPLASACMPRMPGPGTRPRRAQTAKPARRQAHDGSLRLQDGKGQWWEGLDPQDLYAQNHPRSANADKPNGIHSQWNWGNGATVPPAPTAASS